MTDIQAVRNVLAGLGIGAPDLHTAGKFVAFRVGPGKALALWRRLRDVHDRTGLWPLMLGDDSDLAGLVHNFGLDPDAEIARGLAMDLAARMAQWRTEATEFADEGEDVPPRGEATGLRPPAEDVFYLAERPGWLGLLAADAGYLVPGLVTWVGAANYDIEPADHVAMLKRWHDQYGAELVGLGGDVIELWVPRPPTDQASIMAVAEEQYWYCQDVIDQGVLTLDALAAVQVPARRWYFWWD
jgi:hypothetical protein